MRRDLVIGFVFTISLEALIAWGGDLSHFKAKPKVKEEEPTIQISMPKIEPDEPDVVEDKPIGHDGRWALATTEVCKAILESGRTRQEGRLTHQCRFAQEGQS